MLSRKKQTGFTLVETIIYTTMVSIVVGALLSVIYNMIVTRGGFNRALSLTENKKFLIQKMVWALQSTNTINAPQPDTSESMLSVNKIGAAENPIVIDNAAGAVRITSGGGTALNLTTEDVTAVNVLFEHASTTAYEWIRITGELGNTAGSTTLDYTFVIR